MPRHGPSRTGAAPIAMAADPASVAETAVPANWTAAFDAISSQSERWKRGRRLTHSNPDYIEPRAFCDAVLSAALADRQFLKTSARADFFAWACAQPKVKMLVPVVAAHDCLARGDKDGALAHLDLALVLDQEDLYAQELWFSARGEPLKKIDSTKQICPNPFTRLESASQNRLMFCCPAWLPIAVGSLNDETAEDVWNSTTAQDIRASIHDGSYRYCSRMHCPKFEDGSLQQTDKINDPDLRAAWETKAVVLPPKIKRIALAHDRSCNISCPSCRTKLIIADRVENTRLDALTDRALLPLILAARRINITGSGDPFSSKHYRNLIRRLTSLPPGPIIDLQTNGLLLAKSWSELGLEGRVGNVLVSIDAATKATYEVIRRGGVFEDLLENLAFLSELRKSGRVKNVNLEFVTQALNYVEMPAAVDIMRSYGFDKIKFQMLRSWNTWSPQEFKKQHVGSPEHAEFGAFQDVMLDPRFAASDVKLSGFYSTMSRRSSSAIKSAPKVAFSNGDARQSSSRA